MPATSTFVGSRDSALQPATISESAQRKYLFRMMLARPNDYARSRLFDTSREASCSIMSGASSEVPCLSRYSLHVTNTFAAIAALPIESHAACDLSAGDGVRSRHLALSFRYVRF